MDEYKKETGFFDQLIKNHTQSERSSNTPDTELNADFSFEEVLPDDHILREDNRHSDILNDTVNNKGMPVEARQVLVTLLRHGVILSSQKIKLFASLCRYQNDIREYLSEIYLKLILDERAGVAFIANINDEEDKKSLGMDDDEETLSIISRRTLSLYDTLLLLVLRKHYQDRESSGEQKIIIDIERIESNLTPFLPLTNSTKSDRKKLNGALNKMVNKKILSSVRGSDDRFEITPIIRYVVNAEFLEKMLADYLNMANEKGITSGKKSSGINDDGETGHDYVN
ncbi:DUF4194 domain-containing protein [Xenorhabdus cabanillasii]|uniref:DUF4194 domain-containing protein n=1 Tax=Xenorhabdus cabanillasii JM26 TaxID=1427517 RepID=W1IQN4_9GAMM|nr:DUF4194 domain-containing protein [Xenorhabdus cabanillasii]PHM77104.1 hypothetical protein Xcab_02403 [Xenorhabdus cabanillasii JM26]CDL79525.1 conserved hypothetical protein [Xenorhabdus cabanillasii JM26]